MPHSPDRRTALRVGASLLGAAALGCVAHRPALEPAVREAEGDLDGRGPRVRVLLGAGSAPVELGGNGEWRLFDRDEQSVVVRAGASQRWRVEQRGGQLRAVRPDGVASAWRSAPLVARPVEPWGLLSVGGKQYRGELIVLAGDSGPQVVNRLPLEDYLRGVVPLEIGNRPAGERAAAEAQAVAARSYALARLRGASAGAAGWELRAGTIDQVYGGADAEREVCDAAVAGTAGLVLTYAGRLVNTPYHSTCGGNTAEPTEVWKARGEPHLQRVSDRMPGTDRCWCDPAPRFAWTRRLEQAELGRVLRKHLGEVASVPAGGVGVVRELRVEETTGSGRVAALTIVADRGLYRLRGNEIRAVLRTPAGEMLNSTYFTVQRPPAARGESPAVATLVGRGYGHGVGMCQWGAIGRARAGQDYRAILRTYYPGTSVGYAD